MCVWLHLTAGQAFGLTLGAGSKGPSTKTNWRLGAMRDQGRVMIGILISYSQLPLRQPLHPALHASSTPSLYARSGLSDSSCSIVLCFLAWRNSRAGLWSKTHGHVRLTLFQRANAVNTGLIVPDLHPGMRMVKVNLCELLVKVKYRRAAVAKSERRAQACALWV